MITEQTGNDTGNKLVVKGCTPCIASPFGEPEISPKEIDGSRRIRRILGGERESPSCYVRMVDRYLDSE